MARSRSRLSTRVPERLSTATWFTQPIRMRYKDTHQFVNALEEVLKTDGIPYRVKVRSDRWIISTPLELTQGQLDRIEKLSLRYYKENHTTATPSTKVTSDPLDEVGRDSAEGVNSDVQEGRLGTPLPAAAATFTSTASTKSLGEHVMDVLRIKRVAGFLRGKTPAIQNVQ